MHLSMDFVFTPADWRQLISCQRSRWSRMLRPAVVLGAIVLGVQHLLTSGLYLYLGLYLLIPLFLCAPCLFLCFYRPEIHVSIEDETICVECNDHKQIFRWSSFVRFGSATEYKNHFCLECGRGSVWIPKRAFLTDTDLEAFRQFVSENMGERCKFSVGEQ